MTDATQNSNDFALSRIELLTPVEISTLRKMTPAEKFQLAASLHTQARKMLSRLLRAEHPE